eukprot:Skav233631  [mRNA]  locus=scaffold492:87998:97182:- [translate_table: standard]
MRAGAPACKKWKTVRHGVPLVMLQGKDTDLVEDAKYVGDASFLKDMPDKYRVDPESKEYLKDCEEGTKGFAHADVAIPWYMHKHHEDIEECIDGFTRNWETRVFWFNGEFLYLSFNQRSDRGISQGFTGDDIPEEFLENAKRIGQEAIKAHVPVLLGLERPSWMQCTARTLIRTDVGCSDSKDTKWDPNGRTFFLNEIECPKQSTHFRRYGGTTYFIRHLKEDFVPKTFGCNIRGRNVYRPGKSTAF